MQELNVAKESSWGACTVTRQQEILEFWEIGSAFVVINNCNNYVNDHIAA
jgi:hypothetical protein